MGILGRPFPGGRERDDGLPCPVRPGRRNGRVQRHGSLVHDLGRDRAAREPAVDQAAQLQLPLPDRGPDGDVVQVGDRTGQELHVIPGPVHVEMTADHGDDLPLGRGPKIVVHLVRKPESVRERRAPVLAPDLKPVLPAGLGLPGQLHLPRGESLQPGRDEFPVQVNPGVPPDSPETNEDPPAVPGRGEPDLPLEPGKSRLPRPVPVDQSGNRKFPPSGLRRHLRRVTGLHRLPRTV